jgi:ADP-heptose:LPS heptosyltransferase
MALQDKVTSNFRFYFLNLLSKKYQAQILSKWAGRKTDPKQIIFSQVADTIKQALIILPDDPLETTRQLPTIIALQKLFPNADFSYFCRNDMAEFIRELPGITKIIAYMPESTLLFSETARNWIQTLREQRFDACFYLDRNPDIKLFYICTSANIPLRITYASSDAESFFNITIRPQSESEFLVDRNLSLVKCLGYKGTLDNYSLELNENITGPISAWLNSMGHTPQGSLIGVSLDLEDRLLEKLITELLLHKNKIVLFPSYKNPHLRKDSIETLPGNIFQFEGRSFAETLACAHACNYIIAPQTPLFYLAWLQRIPAVGIFNKPEPGAWPKPSSIFRAVFQENSSDPIEEILQYLSDIYQNK